MFCDFIYVDFTIIADYSHPSTLFQYKRILMNTASIPSDIITVELYIFCGKCFLFILSTFSGGISLEFRGEGGTCPTYVSIQV